MLHVLFKDLFKAGKKGAQWSAEKRKYLWRILLPTGKYRYFPDKAYGENLEDFGRYENGKWVWSAGLTTTKVINRLMLGGPVTVSDTSDTLKVNPTTGKPYVKDGLLRHYEVVDKTIYDNAQELRAKQGYVPDFTDARLIGTANKLTHHADGSKKDVLERTTIKTGKREWYVFAYPKSPVHARDESGKATQYAGFVSIDNIDPSIADSIDMSKFRKDIRDHQISHTSPVSTTPPKRPDASLVQQPDETDDDFVQRRKQSELAAMHAAGAVLPGDKHLLNAPAPPPADTLRALGLPTTGKVDISEIKASLLRRVYESAHPKKQRDARVAERREIKVDEAAGARAVEIPDWIRAKFRDQEELARMIERKPATFLLTIGAFKPDRRSAAFNERLVSEWLPEIYGLCRHDADALKFTRNYEAWREMDAKLGIDSTHPESKVRRHMSRVTSDMAQNLTATLTELMTSYTPTTEPTDRFDRLAYVTMRNTASSLARQWAKQHGQLVPFVHESEKDDAAHRLRQNAPLSPQEMAELSMLSTNARQALANAFESMHPTHRAVFLARQYLDDPEEERAEISERNALRDVTIAAHEQQGKQLPRLRHMRKERSWQAIAAKHPRVIDPSTGKELVLHGDGALHQTARDKHLSKLYTEAADHLRRYFSTSGHSVDSPKHERTEVLMGDASLPREERSRRVLTNEGRDVMRYLELERKLADSARGARRATIASEEDRTIYGTLPEGKTRSYIIAGKRKTVPVTPRMEPLRQQVVIPAVSTSTSTRQHTADPAINYFNAPDNAGLAAKLGLHSGASTRGSRLQSPGTSITTLPNVRPGQHTMRHVAAAQQHYERLESYKKLSPEALREEKTRLTGIAKRFTALTSHGGAADQLHEAAMNLSAIRAKHKTMRQAYKERKAELSSAIFSPDEIAHKLKHHKISDADKKALAAAETRFAAAVEKVHDTIPLKSLADAITESYRTSTDEAKPITKEHRSVVNALHQSRMTAVRHRLALIEHEEGRRAAAKKVHKSMIDASRLMRALDDYDFAVARYVAEVA